MGRIGKFFIAGSGIILFLFASLAFAEDINTATFPAGTEITLTATPDTGSVFIKWEGDFCNGSKAKTCTFVMPDRTVNINARFDKRLAAPKWRRSIGGNL